MRNLFLIFFSISLSAFSQSSFNSGWLPKINISTKVSDNIKWVNSLESRELIYKDDFVFEHSLTDVASIFSLKTSVDQSLNLGYLIRFRKNGDVIHRFLQHYNIVSNFDAFRLGHRLGFEQFFQKNKKPELRTRYRATFQKALNGDKVDVKEFYIKLANEYLWNLTDEDFEMRWSPYLGYKLSKYDKLEFGLDYRLSEFIDSNPKHNVWFRTTWYITLQK